jgi:hypothetical protein
MFIHVFVESSPANTTDCSQTSITVTNVLSGSLVRKRGLNIVRHTLKNLYLKGVGLSSTATPLSGLDIAPSVWVTPPHPRSSDWSHGVVITNCGTTSMTIFGNADGLSLARIRLVTRPLTTR